ncbi:MAG: hypothetical protein KDE35_11230 [Geminicoccaceae bacterium]|nr:hypothetical protein [Geminicoccaceae bacterium]
MLLKSQSSVIEVEEVDVPRYDTNDRMRALTGGRQRSVFQTATPTDRAPADPIVGWSELFGDEAGKHRAEVVTHVSGTSR